MSRKGCPNCSFYHWKVTNTNTDEISYFFNTNEITEKYKLCRTAIYHRSKGKYTHPDKLPELQIKKVRMLV